MLIAALPVLELRGAIPVGIWMGMPAVKVAALAIVGNILPIAPLLYALRFGPVQALLKPVLDRAASKASSLGDAAQRAQLLAAFVGVPLPGTGAWTGAMCAFLLGMPFGQAVGAISLGVVASGAIMTAVTTAGPKGAAALGALLLGPLIAPAIAKALGGGGGGGAPAKKKQDFLEATPYFDQSNIPINTFKAKVK